MLDLFTPVVAADRLNPVFTQFLRPENGPEREVLEQWARGFVDRDRKFVQQLQLTFESSFWELYLHAYLRELSCEIDFGYTAPDFVVARPTPFIVEATIAAPPLGGAPPVGWTAADIPSDLAAFNMEAALRVCNAFSAKYRKYTQAYSRHADLADLPYVISIGAFDRPLAHMSAARPVMAALYGLYHDEELTKPGARNLVQYNVSGATKHSGSVVPLGLFLDDTYAEVSAVVYSSLATWGKVRALAKKPDGASIFSTLHPNPDGLLPIRRRTTKRDYREDLLDGLFVLHNPFAKRPILPGVLEPPRFSRRLFSLRGLSHEEVEQVFT